MSLADKRRPRSKLFRLLAIAATAMLAAAVSAVVYLAGYPIMSIWLAGAILSWLFVLGAREESEPDSADHDRPGPTSNAGDDASASGWEGPVESKIFSRQDWRR